MNAAAIAAAKAVREEAEQISAALKTKLSEVTFALEVAQANLVLAHTAFDKAPSSDTAGAVNAAAVELARAQASERKTKEAIENAERSVQTAKEGEQATEVRAALNARAAQSNEARQAEERAQLERMNAPTARALLAAASPDVFHASAAPHVKRALDALFSVRDAFNAIDEHFAASCEASTMYTAATGVALAPLDSAHVLLGLTESLIDQGFALDEFRQTLRYACTPSVAKNNRPIGPSSGEIVAVICRLLDRGAAAPEKIAREKAKNGFARQTRTCHEAASLEREDEARVAAQNAELARAGASPTIVTQRPAEILQYARKGIEAVKRLSR